MMFQNDAKFSLHCDPLSYTFFTELTPIFFNIKYNEKPADIMDNSLFPANTGMDEAGMGIYT
jgi:hypothetical protein